MLNLLLGVGGTGTLHLLTNSTSHSIAINFSPTLWVSASGLVLILVATGIFVPLNGYMIGSAMGGVSGRGVSSGDGCERGCGDQDGTGLGITHTRTIMHAVVVVTLPSIGWYLPRGGLFCCRDTLCLICWEPGALIARDLAPGHRLRSRDVRVLPQLD